MLRFSSRSRKSFFYTGDGAETPLATALKAPSINRILKRSVPPELRVKLARLSDDRP
jgi:hypothetical protein